MLMWAEWGSVMLKEAPDPSPRAIKYHFWMEAREVASTFQ